MDNTTAATHAIAVTPKIKLTPREFFLWAGIVISLYASVSAVLTIIFTSLNKAFPDSLDGGYLFSGQGIGTLSAPISIVIVLFPVFTLLTVYANRFLRKNPEHAALGFRKFVIWLTLFLSGILVATDLIVLVHYFLSGEVTTRFILKVLAVLVVAAVVGGYYVYDLKRDVTVKNKTGMFFAIAGYAIVVFSFVLAFSILGGPQNQRKLTFDTMRISTMQSVEQGVVEYWRNHGKMPATLDDVKTYEVVKDPEAAAGKMIEYRPTGGTNYEICATFSADSVEDPSATPYAYYENDSFLPEGTPRGDAWKHTAGRTCFNRTIDAEEYPVYEKSVKN